MYGAAPLPPQSLSSPEPFPAAGSGFSVFASLPVLGSVFGSSASFGAMPGLLLPAASFSSLPARPALPS